MPGPVPLPLPLPPRASPEQMLRNAQRAEADLKRLGRDVGATISESVRGTAGTAGVILTTGYLMVSGAVNYITGANATVQPATPPATAAQPQTQTPPQTQAQPQTATTVQMSPRPIDKPAPQRHKNKKGKKSRDKDTRTRSGDKQPPGYKPRVPKRPQDMEPKPPKKPNSNN